MVECTNMGQVASIVNCFKARQDVLTVTRIKDRFFKSPSADGWRDIMINFYFNNDPNKHICELQLVHYQMMAARKGLPGHAVYNRVRNASELLMFKGGVQPRGKDELQKMLVYWMTNGKDNKSNYYFDVLQFHPNLWDVSLITDMKNLFSGCYWVYKDELKDFNEDISNWDVSNVTTMWGVFSSSNKFNQPIGKWDVSNVTNMREMFNRSKAFNQPIGTWDVSKVTNMYCMFNSTKVADSLANTKLFLSSKT